MKDTYAYRSDIIRWIFAISTLGLVIQSARLQLFDDTYQKIAQRTTINKKVIEPARGIFYDRTGKVLTYNDPVYDLMCTRNLVQEMDTVFFCQLLDLTKEDFLEGLNKNFRGRFYSRSIPYTFLKGIDRAKYARFQEHLQEFPGFDIKIRNLRDYPIRHGANVLGYVSEVSQEQIEGANGQYSAGDLIGSRGLEKHYDDEIRGRKGLQLVLKDNRGKDVSAYEDGRLDTAAVPGYDIVTTLDFDLQALGEELLSYKNGSIVAIEPKSGEILAMVSSPNFDPNLLSITDDRGAMFDSLTNDPNNPFLDRTVSAKYPPGSIFKTVVGLIALQEDLIYPNKAMNCTGGYQFNDSYWGCRSHPYPANMAIALQYSCNTYFYQVYRYIIDQYGFYEPQKGLDRMNKYLADFGLGRKLNVDYPFEKKGNMPSSRYYDRQYRSAVWKSPTIISNAIGQGELELTTIQMANLAAIMANHGNYRIPHLIKEYKNVDKEIPLRYRVKNNVGIDSVHFNIVRKGMELAGQRASFSGVKVAGKTGTSQNIGQDHSVFFAYAPADNPQIAIAVYVENAGSGGAIARPIASYMIEKYLTRDISEGRRAYMNYVKSIRTSIIPESKVLDTLNIPQLR